MVYIHDIIFQVEGEEWCEHAFFDHSDIFDVKMLIILPHDVKHRVYLMQVELVSKEYMYRL